MATGILCMLLGFLAGILFGLLARSAIENRLSSKEDDDFTNSIMNKNQGNSPLKFADMNVDTKPKARPKVEPTAKVDLGKKYADRSGFVLVQCGGFGRLINVLPEGTKVEKGARVATFESMKMEIYCTAPEAGYIVETLPVGEQLDSGDTIVVINTKSDSRENFPF